MKNWTPIVISGPTGCGKSALALELARLIDGEIVCADSRQIYEGMRIGAAGPSEAELRVVPHHLFHVVDPKQLFDAGQYRTRCTERIADIQSRMRTPIVVGGTGLYLRALRFGLEDVPGKDDVIRDALNAQLESEGLDALHLELARVDPQTAALVAPQDPIRILRALELFRITGTKASTLRQSHGTKIQLQAIWINLQLRRDLLLKRLENRALGMWTGGLIDEAVALKKVLGDAHPLLKTMGYEEALVYASGELSEKAALERINIRQRQYARRQRTWFKKETWHRIIEANDPLCVQKIQELRDAYPQGW